jgi:hypothetical protein
LWLGWCTCVTSSEIAEQSIGTRHGNVPQSFAKCAARLSVAQDCKWTTGFNKAFVTFKMLHGTRLNAIRKVRPSRRQFHEVCRWLVAYVQFWSTAFYPICRANVWNADVNLFTPLIKHWVWFTEPFFTKLALAGQLSVKNSSTKSFVYTNTCT